jgi:L-threonylcarbamoyladenylate synthase
MLPDRAPRTSVLSWRPDDPALVKHLASCLESGGLVAFPTDTVYGLGANAELPSAIEALYEAKGRPSVKPLPVLIASVRALRRTVREVPLAAEELADRYWPGPLTMVLPRGPRILDVVAAGLPSVGVRVPDHPIARAILAACPFPVAVTSANLSGQAEAVTAEQVFDQLAGRIDLLLDGGPCPGGRPSTVIDLTTDPPVILREGPIASDELLAIVAEFVDPH